MAKASKEDIQKVIAFFRFIEEYFEYGTHTPENDEVEEESIELSESDFVERLSKLWAIELSESDFVEWGGRFKPVGVDCMWSRVVFGCDMLIDNCCDPNSDVLEWKPEIVELLHEAAVVEEQ